jgi:hypothetical protein
MHAFALADGSAPLRFHREERSDVSGPRIGDVAAVAVAAVGAGVIFIRRETIARPVTAQ